MTCLNIAMCIFGWTMLLPAIAVCDVDPSDTVSILLEQWKTQAEQLKLSRAIIDGQAVQLSVHQEQLKLLKIMIEQPHYPSTGLTIFASVMCSILGFLALFILKRLLAWFMKRYKSPEMPQTAEDGLIDFASLTQPLVVLPDQPGFSGCERSTLSKSPEFNPRSDE